MASSPDEPEGVPFTFFVSLVRKISKIPPKPAAMRPEDPLAHPARDLFRQWVAELHRLFSPLPTDTIAVVLKLLFPEEDNRRKYDLRETTLGGLLADCLGFSPDNLRQWQSKEGSGCLGFELQRIMEHTHSNPTESTSSLNITQVDEYLDELAACSPFTDNSIRSKYPSASRRLKRTVLSHIFRKLSPADAACVTQIILKDLKPLLYPPSEKHYTAALKTFNSRAIRMLTKEDVMFEWDPSSSLYNTSKVVATLDEAAKMYGKQSSNPTQPRVGTFIQIPKSEKGRGCKHAVQLLQRSKKVYAETKYDGERAQIHVEVQSNGNKPRITIFSKSKRDSTLDRVAVHPIIRQALGFAEGDTPRVRQNVILDAEMVAYDDDHIDEFWRIRALIESTAYGVRGSRRISGAQKTTDEHVPASQCSLASSISTNRHLALVFFDILYLDSSSTLCQPYAQRRALLEAIIRPIPHHAFLAERRVVDLRSNSSSESLFEIFGKIISEHEEGAVLKAEESVYHDRSLPWVKLKRDYIPGLGDCLDMVVLGASWDKERARELNVTPDTLTTFYIGIIENLAQVKHNPNTLPSFHIYFTASYGLSREQLEEANFLIKSSDHLEYDKRAPPRDGLSYAYNLLPSLPPPDVLLRVPLLAEVFGDRFTKAPKSKHYELRFPRISKLHRLKERTWRDGVTPEELHRIAREVVGRDRKDKDIDDWCNSVWGKPSSPSIRSAKKREWKKEEWVSKLRAADGLPPLPTAADGLKSRNKTTAFLGMTSKNMLSLAHDDTSDEEVPSPLATRTNRPLPAIFGPPLQPPTELHGKSPSLSPGIRAPTSDEPSLKRRKIASTVDPPKSAKIAPKSLIPHTPILTHNAIPTPQTSPISATPTTHTRCDSQLKESQSMKDFLCDSLVWVACSRSQGVGSMPDISVSCALPISEFGALIPPENELHSMESLFIGCGWPKDVQNNDAYSSSCKWAKRGVIFIEDITWLQHVMHAIYRRKEAMYSPGRQGGGVAVNTASKRKPIWVFDYKVLVQGPQIGDLEQHALCHSD